MTEEAPSAGSTVAVLIGTPSSCAFSSYEPSASSLHSVEASMEVHTWSSGIGKSQRMGERASSARKAAYFCTASASSSPS